MIASSSGFNLILSSTLISSIWRSSRCCKALRSQITLASSLNVVSNHKCHPSPREQRCWFLQKKTYITQSTLAKATAESISLDDGCSEYSRLLPCPSRNQFPRVEHLVVLEGGIVLDYISKALNLPPLFVADLVHFGAVHYALVCPKPPPTATPEQFQIYKEVTEPSVLKKRSSIKGKTVREAQKTFRVTDANQFVEAGTYLRVHVHPKRFPRCYEIDWNSRIIAITDTFVVLDKPAATSSCNLAEKAKTKSAKGGGVDFSSFAKGGQQINLAGRTPVRSDIAKAYQVGNFRVLNQEKNIISLTTEDSSSAGKAIDHVGLVPSTASIPLTSQSDQKNKGDGKNGALMRTVSVGERKLLSHAQNRNDFFNLLRKKSLNPSGSIREPGSHGPPEDLQNASSVSVQNCQPGLDFSAENSNLSTDEPDRPYVDNKEANSYLEDSVPDPEEEAFLRSLGWDKNAGEEALTQEEIDAFLKKYKTQTRRSLKISIS